MLPLKIKRGEIKEDCLILETKEKKMEIPWEEIKLLQLGILEEELPSPQKPNYGIQKIIRKIFFGESEKDYLIKSHRKIYLLNFFIKDEILQLDSSNVDYRSFLKEAEYISLNNFKKLIQGFLKFLKNTYLDPSLLAFLKNNKEDIKSYKNIYDFELEGNYLLKDLSKLILAGDFLKDVN
ncbi:MAG: hypothetical protein HYU63_04385 [Armatimonadetes bacterium]|nr:hypothetical protein [Armatimonadota bacterium]